MENQACAETLVIAALRELAVNENDQEAFFHFAASNE